jgi:hypothetical protein
MLLYIIVLFILITFVVVVVVEQYIVGDKIYALNKQLLLIGYV